MTHSPRTPNSSTTPENGQGVVDFMAEIRSESGASIQDVLGGDAVQVCDEFLEYAGRAFAGYSQTTLSKEKKAALEANGQERSVKAFPNASTFRFSNTLELRGYIIGKFGDPNEVTETDEILVLCEDGRLRSTIIEAAEHAIPEHRAHRQSKLAGFRGFVGRTATPDVRTADLDTSRQLHLGVFLTDPKHRLHLVQPGNESTLNSVLSQAIGRNFAHGKLKAGAAIDAAGRRTTVRTLRARREREQAAVTVTPDRVDNVHYLADIVRDQLTTEVRSASVRLGRNPTLEELDSLRASARERVVRESLGDNATDDEVQEWLDLVSQVSTRGQRDGGKRERSDGQSQGGRERESYEDKAARLSPAEKQRLIAIDDEVMAEIERERPYWDGNLTSEEQKERNRVVRNEVYARYFPGLDDRQAAEILGIIKALRGSR